MTARTSDSRTSASSLHSASTDSRSRSSVTDLTNTIEPGSPYRVTDRKAHSRATHSPGQRHEPEKVEDDDESLNEVDYTTYSLSREVSPKTIPSPVDFAPANNRDRLQYYDEPSRSVNLTISILDLDLLVQALVNAPIIQMHIRRQWYDDNEDCLNHDPLAQSTSNPTASPSPDETAQCRERRRSSAGILPGEDPSSLIHNHHTRNTCSRPPLSSLVIADPRVSGSPIRYTIPPTQDRLTNPQSLLGQCSFVSLPYGASTAGTLRITPAFQIKQHVSDDATKKKMISKVTYQMTSQILARRSQKKKFLLSAETDVTRGFIRAAIAELAEQKGLHPEDISISSSPSLWKEYHESKWQSMKRHFYHLTPDTASMQTLTLLSTLARLERQHADFYVLKPSTGRRHSNGTPEGVRVPFVSQGMLARSSHRRRHRSCIRKARETMSKEDDDSRPGRQEDQEDVYGKKDYSSSESDFEYDEDEEEEEDEFTNPNPRKYIRENTRNENSHQRIQSQSRRRQKQQQLTHQNIDDQHHHRRRRHHLKTSPNDNDEIEDHEGEITNNPQISTEKNDDDEDDDDETEKAARFFREELITLVSKYGYIHRPRQSLSDDDDDDNDEQEEHKKSNNFSFRDFGADVGFPGQGIMSVRFVPVVGSGEFSSSSVPKRAKKKEKRSSSNKKTMKKRQEHSSRSLKNPLESGHISKKDEDNDDNHHDDDDDVEVMWICFVRERGDAMAHY